MHPARVSVRDAIWVTCVASHGINVVGLGTVALEWIAEQQDQRDWLLLAGISSWSDRSSVGTTARGAPIDAGCRRCSFALDLERPSRPGVRVNDPSETPVTVLMGEGMHVKVVSEMPVHSSTAITNDSFSRIPAECGMT